MKKIITIFISFGLLFVISSCKNNQLSNYQTADEKVVQALTNNAPINKGFSVDDNRFISIYNDSTIYNDYSNYNLYDITSLKNDSTYIVCYLDAAKVPTLDVVSGCIVYEVTTKEINHIDLSAYGTIVRNHLEHVVWLEFDDLSNIPSKINSYYAVTCFYMQKVKINKIITEEIIDINVECYYPVAQFLDVKNNRLVIGENTDLKSFYDNYQVYQFIGLNEKELTPNKVIDYGLFNMQYKQTTYNEEESIGLTGYELNMHLLFDQNKQYRFDETILTAKEKEVIASLLNYRGVIKSTYQEVVIDDNSYEDFSERALVNSFFNLKIKDIYIFSQLFNNIKINNPAIQYECDAEKIKQITPTQYQIHVIKNTDDIALYKNLFNIDQFKYNDQYFEEKYLLMVPYTYLREYSSNKEDNLQPLKVIVKTDMMFINFKINRTYQEIFDNWYIVEVPLTVRDNLLFDYEGYKR